MFHMLALDGRQRDGGEAPQSAALRAGGQEAGVGRAVDAAAHRALALLKNVVFRKMNTLFNLRFPIPFFRKA